MLTVTNETHRGWTVCRLGGELDAGTVVEVREALSQLVGHRRIVIDLSVTRFMDSAGLGALIGAIRRAREVGGDVAVACASGSALRRLLHTCGFDRIVVLRDSVDAAIDGVCVASPPSIADAVGRG